MSVRQRKLGRPILKSELFSEALRSMGRMTLLHNGLNGRIELDSRGLRNISEKGIKLELDQIKMLLSSLTTFIIGKR